jgi:hypothetical protein
VLQKENKGTAYEEKKKKSKTRVIHIWKLILGSKKELTFL